MPSLGLPPKKKPCKFFKAFVKSRFYCHHRNWQLQNIGKYLQPTNGALCCMSPYLTRTRCQDFKPRETYWDCELQQR